jgi:hypothetical protein
LQACAPPGAAFVAEARPRRVGVQVAAVAVLVAFLVAWYFLALASAMACDGDGGQPYAAPDSPVGRLCRLRGDLSSVIGLLHTAGVTAAPLLILAATTTAIRRRSWAVLLAGTAAASASILLASVPFLVLSNDCSSAQQRAVERWLLDGRPGPPPYDCNTS